MFNHDHVALNLILKLFRSLEEGKVKDDILVDTFLKGVSLFEDKRDIFGDSLKICNDRLSLGAESEKGLPAVVGIIQEIDLSFSSVCGFHFVLFLHIKGDFN